MIWGRSGISGPPFLLRGDKEAVTAAHSAP